MSYVPVRGRPPNRKARVRSRVNRPHKETSVDEDVKLLHHMAHEFEEGINSGDVERIMRFYGDTYVDVNLRNPVQTHAERREYYSQVMRRLAGRIDVTPDEVLVRGDLAFIRGTILLPPRDGADGRLTELRYLEIAERTPDGGWRVVWGMDGPVQENQPVTPS